MVVVEVVTVTDQMMDAYDVVVVGGGAAGLSGALMLARARRSVVVIDAGAPRNAPAAEVHGFLSRDGVSPAELLEIGRAEVRRYGGHVVAGEVSAAVRDSGGFVVTLADDRSVRARRLLVATGLADELPDVPGLRARWGRDVLHCPYCHGWEVRDQAIGVLAGGPMAVHQALLFRQWSADVTLFSHTAAPPEGEQAEQLAARGIRVVPGEVESLEIVDDQLTGVRLRSGEVVARRALAVMPRMAARAGFLAALGLEPTEHPQGEYLAGDATGLTAVPGVWVAGNVADLTAQVGGAAAAGAFAAASLNADLVAEDTRRAVTAYRDPFSAASEAHVAELVAGERRHGLFDMSDQFGEVFWEEFYASRAEVWSGRPNPQLVAESAELTTGAALDVGSGEGADAIWLASRGWQVTAVDLATTALQRAAAQAEARGADVAGRIRWVRADLTRWTPGEGTFDLVSAQFMHLPAVRREALFRKMAVSVRPGGTLLIVGHHPSDLQTVPRPHRSDLYFTAEEVASSLDPGQWDIVVADARSRCVTTPDGQEHTLHDAVLRARRRSK
jgi:thioredoxin reductase/SAM-dependent methyltransferase